MEQVSVSEGARIETYHYKYSKKPLYPSGLPWSFVFASSGSVITVIKKAKGKERLICKGI